MLKLPSMVALGTLACVAAAARAQQAAVPRATVALAATGSKAGPAPAGNASVALAGTTITGSVVDTNGEPVEGAEVELRCGSGLERSISAGEDGLFRFEGVAAGSCTVSVTATGFSPAGTALTLSAASGAAMNLSPLVMRVAPVETEVEAISQKQMAEIQIHREEQQRLLGVLPNFYIAYEPNTVALDARQKYELAFKTIFDPSAFAVTGLIAGVEQATNAYSGYGQGAAGYGKRYGAAYADFAVGNMLSGAVLPALMRQDPRYFYKGTGSVWSRARYAIVMAVVAKGDNGQWQPAYASLLGSLGQGAISNLYYPASNRHGVALTFGNAGLSVVGDAVGNVVQEFFLKRVTSKTPKLLQP